MGRGDSHAQSCPVDHCCRNSPGDSTSGLVDDCVHLDTRCLQDIPSCTGSMALTQLGTRIWPCEWGLMRNINPTVGKDSAAKRTGVFQDFSRHRACV